MRHSVPQHLAFSFQSPQPHLQPPPNQPPGSQGPQHLPPMGSPTMLTNEPQGVPSLLAEINQGLVSEDGKKKYGGLLGQYHQAGRLIPRLVSPWVNITGAITRGMIADGYILDSSAGMDLSEEQLQSHKTQEEAYRKILNLVPGLQDALRSLSVAASHMQFLGPLPALQLAKIISQGADKARTADTHKVKRDLVRLLKDQVIQDVGSLGDKSGRGFEHPYTSRLLCPIKYLSEFDADTTGAFQLRMKKGTVDVGSYDFPSFLYDDSRIDNDPFKGLCRGFLLIRVVEHMLFGSGVPTKAEDKKPTKGCVAEIHNIKTISPELIAYGAVQARNALSSTTQWPMADGNFDLTDFYGNVLELFENAEDEWTKETLAWWQNTFFHSGGFVRRKRKGPPAPAPSTSDKMRLKRLRQERAAAADRQRTEEDSPQAGNTPGMSGPESE